MRASVVLCAVVWLSCAAASTLFLDSSKGSDSKNNSCTDDKRPCATFDSLVAVGEFFINTPLTVAVPLSISRKSVTITVHQPQNGPAFTFTHGPLMGDSEVRGVNFVSTSAASRILVVRGASAVTLQARPTRGWRVPVWLLTDWVAINQNVVFADCAGGSVSIEEQSTVTMTECQISKNAVPLLVTNATLLASNSQFTDNRGGACGGVINAVTGSQVQLTDVSLRGNVAQAGGALCVIDSVCTLSGATPGFVCSDNTASTASGGCLYASGATASVSISGTASLNRNSAALSGGAVFTTNVQSVSLDSVSMDSNSAALAGGALAVNGTSTVTLLRVTCTNNDAAQLGGCVYANATSFLNLGAGTVIKANTASSGGGLWALDAAIAFSQMSFDGNKASRGNGGAYEAVGGTLDASNTQIVNNGVATMGSGAAGMLRAGIAFTLSNVNISHNSFSSTRRAIAGDDEGDYEGAVCASSTGAVTGDGGVVCAPGCALTLNGNSGACSSQPRHPPNARHSNVAAPPSGTVQLVAQNVAVVSVFIRDAYNWSVPLLETQDLQVTLWKSGLLVLTTVIVAPLPATGAYNVSVYVPYADSFLLNFKLDGAPIKNSPLPVKAGARPGVGTDLTILWVVLGLGGGLAVFVAVVLVWRKFGRRRAYAPLADGSTTSTHYGGVGFATETESEEV